VFESAASERDAFVAQLKATEQEQLNRTDEVVTALSDTAGRIHREIARFEEDQVRKMLDAVATLTDDREGIKRQAEQQLAAVSEIGRELVGSISESQLKLAERLSAITSLLEGQKALASIQENLVHNLALLNDSEVYQRTLLTLEQLRPVLERLGIRSDGEVIVAKPARAWWHFWRR
jgi:spore cortex formation protein SpoVR/YcgB (stage V sporulation)